MNRNIDAKGLEASLEKFRSTRRFTNLSFQLLSKLDPQFKRLQAISPGLRVGIALKSLVEHRFCLMCKDNLASVEICRSCLQTPEGQSLSKERRYQKAGSTRRSRSTAEKKATLDKSRQTNLTKYGTENPRQNSEVKAKARTTCIHRYGVDNPSKAGVVKAKKVDTCLRNYGVEHPLQKQELLDKARATWMKNLGVDQPMKSAEVRAKSVVTNISRRGVPYAVQSPEVKAATKRTVEERFGGYPMQNAAILEKARKSRFSLKKVNILGKEHSVQGFEPQVLRWLEDNDYLRRLTCRLSNMPEIWYRDAKGRDRRYFPDFVFESKSGQLFIAEVKSPFTLMAPDVLPKAQATLEFCRKSHGKFRYAFGVFNRKEVKWIRSTQEFLTLRKSYESN